MPAMRSPEWTPLRLPPSLLCLGSLASLVASAAACTPEPSPIDPFATTATTMQMTTDSATATVGDETTGDSDSDDPEDVVGARSASKEGHVGSAASAAANSLAASPR